MRLVLASASPRRAEILRNAGISFEVRSTSVDESRHEGELPGEYVRRLALEKARAAVHADRQGSGGETIFIGADTVVVVNGEIFGKPVSEEEARRMLGCLSARVHEVHTGIALIQRPGDAEKIAEEITRVTFAALSEGDIENYMATGEPFGKAGAYAVQGIGGRYVTRIEGCYFNVVGLPLARLMSLLRESGWRD